MAAEVIYQAQGGDLNSASWCVERQPYGCTDPMVVSFRKWNRDRSLLNQSARWTGSGWDRTRWFPKPPAVSGAVIELVESHMRKAQP